MTLEPPKVDLTKFTPEQLKEALAQIDAKKDNDRNAYKELVEKTVPKAIFKLCTASEVLSNAKTEAFQFFEDILKLKADVYGIKEKQQSYTFSSDMGEITIGYRITDGWDDPANTGIAKVEKFITSLANNSETEALVEGVLHFLKKMPKGT